MNETIALLKRRRSAPPAVMSGPGPTPEELETILSVASRVPDHGKLAPWRFIVFEGAARRTGGRIAARIRTRGRAALDDKAKAEELGALCPRAAGDRGRFARRAACEDPGMGAGAVGGRRLHEPDCRGQCARLHARPGSPNGRAYDARFRAAIGLPSMKTSPASCTSAGRTPIEDRLRPALADIVTTFPG